METHKRNRIIAIGAVVLLLVLVSWLFFCADSRDPAYVPDKVVVIDNSQKYMSGLKEDVFISIGKGAFAALEANDIKGKNVYHGIVRDNTFKKTQSSVSFILDLPEEKVSWRVGQGIDKDGQDYSDPQVSCIIQEEAIYDVIENCKDTNNGFKTPEQQAFMEMTKILPLMGPTYSVSFSTTNQNELGYTLNATVYGETGRADVAAAFQSLGYNIDDYPINYDAR